MPLTHNAMSRPKSPIYDESLQRAPRAACATTRASRWLSRRPRPRYGISNTGQHDPPPETCERPEAPPNIVTPWFLRCDRTRQQPDPEVTHETYTDQDIACARDCMLSHHRRRERKQSEPGVPACLHRPRDRDFVFIAFSRWPSGAMPFAGWAAVRARTRA